MNNEIKEENPNAKEEDDKKDDSSKQENQNNNKNKELLKSKTINIQKKENQEKNMNNNNIEKEKSEEYDSDNSVLSNSDISDNETDSIEQRALTYKKMDLETFYNQSRQYFIMNSGGTPIYSRYGDKIINCSLFATFSAIITKFTVFNGGNSENLNYIKNEFSLIVFIKKGELFLISVSDKNDSVSLLYSQLEILYQYLLSIITNERMKALEENPSNFAKLSLEKNPDTVFEQLIEYTSHSLVSILKAYQVLPVDNRNKLNEICSKYRGKSLITCLIAADDKEVIAISKSSLIELKFSDMILIQCLINIKILSGENELWLDICMPGISADGLLKLYYNYDRLNPFGILYITEKQENSSIDLFSENAKKIYDEIKEKKLIQNIEKSLSTKKNADNIKEEIKNNPQEINVETLKEFIKNTFSSKYSKNKLSNLQKNQTFTEAYKNFSISMANPSFNNNLGNLNNSLTKSKLISLGKIICKQSEKSDPFMKLNYGIIYHRNNSQYFSVNIHNYDYLTKEEKYIMKSYIKLYDYFISFKNLNIGENFFHIEKDKKFSHGIYVTENYIILGTFNVFKPTNEINDVFEELLKLVKKYENNLFVSLK